MGTQTVLKCLLEFKARVLQDTDNYVQLQGRFFGQNGQSYAVELAQTNDMRQ